MNQVSIRWSPLGGCLPGWSITMRKEGFLRESFSDLLPRPLMDRLLEIKLSPGPVGITKLNDQEIGDLAEVIRIQEACILLASRIRQATFNNSEVWIIGQGYVDLIMDLKKGKVIPGQYHSFFIK